MILINATEYAGEDVPRKGFHTGEGTAITQYSYWN